MNYLLDVNVLVAWGWKDHTDHERVTRWIAARKKSRADVLVTSAITQLGFVRVSVQRGLGAVTVGSAGKILEGMVTALADSHRFLPDDETSYHWLPWCTGAVRTTDAHLLALAKSHRAALATLDTGIPGAFLIP